MKIMHTLVKEQTTVKNVRVEDGRVLFSMKDGDYEISELTLSDFFSQSEFSEINNIYIFAGEGKVVLRNKLLETESSKRSGGAYILGLGSSITNVGQIYLPFSNSTLQSAVIRFNVDPDKFDESGLSDTERVENSHDAYQALAKSLFPMLRVVSCEKKGDFTEIVIQATLRGEDICREGMRVYAKTDCGYLNRAYALTDESGIARFRFSPLLLDKGEVATIKFGYRNFSNIDSVSVTA